MFVMKIMGKQAPLCNVSILIYKVYEFTIYKKWVY